MSNWHEELEFDYLNEISRQQREALMYERSMNQQWEYAATHNDGGLGNVNKSNYQQKRREWEAKYGRPW